MLEEKTRKLYVSDITPNVTKSKLNKALIWIEDLTDYFKEFGEIVRIKFVDNAKSGKNFAFLLFDAKSVIDKIMGDQEITSVHDLKGASLKCQRTITRAELMDK